MISRFSECMTLQQAAANNVDPQSPPVYLDGTEAAIVASFDTVPVWTKDLDAYSIEFSTPAGSTLENWQTISFWDVGGGLQAASKAVASGVNALLLADRVCCYRWVRLVFTFTSGSGSPKVSLQQKGVS